MLINKKSLSICIPTYNRAEVLDKSLKDLLSNPDFDENKIEIIISDNCSTDNTADIVAKYPFVRYYCNKENVLDFNFSIVLGYATGKYIRLCNDTLYFKEGALKKILDKIDYHSPEESNLFFYNNVFSNRNCVIEVCNRADFLKEVSFYSTWIGNFGCWRADFEKIRDKDRYASLQFPQVDWNYRIVENKKKTIIHFEDFFGTQTLSKKGDYNTFDTFINKYLYIIKQEKISLLRYEIEKYRLFRYLIITSLVNAFIRKIFYYPFSVGNVAKIILKKYWYEPYLSYLIMKFFIKKAGNDIKRIFKINSKTK